MRKSVAVEVEKEPCIACHRLTKKRFVVLEKGIDVYVYTSGNSKMTRSEPLPAPYCTRQCAIAWGTTSLGKPILKEVS